jgi:basic membrane protein A
MRATAVLAAAVMGATGLSGLATTATASAATNRTVGLLLTGPTNDKGYYEDTNAGLMQAAKALHVKTHVISNAGFDESTLVSDARDLAVSGNGLVIGDGGTGAAFQAVAPQFPHTQFIVFTAPNPKPSIKNLHAYLTEQGVTSYMLGVLAGKLTKDGHVGFIGGYQDSPSGEAEAGFDSGAKASNPNVVTSNVIVGSYSDPVGAKSAAASEIANGADVLYGYVDAGLVGVVQAVKASGKPTIVLSATGTVADQNRRCQLGNSVYAQAYQNIPLVFHDMISAYIRGHIPKGTYYYGVGNSAIQRVTFCPAHMNTGQNALMVTTAKHIASGQTSLGSNITGK